MLVAKQWLVIILSDTLATFPLPLHPIQYGYSYPGRAQENYLSHSIQEMTKSTEIYNFDLNSQRPSKQVHFFAKQQQLSNVSYILLGDIHWIHDLDVKKLKSYL